MESLFTWSAIVGGTVLVVQTLLTALGFGLSELDVDHADFDHADAAHDHLLGALSIRALVAFATFFGLAGLAARGASFGDSTALVIGLGAGIAAIFVVGQLMAWLAKLQSSGNLDMRRAVGQRGHVYLRIPPHGDGQGRIHVNVQGRRIEARAIARGDEIATGADVTVVDVSPDGALVVEPAS